MNEKPATPRIAMAELAETLGVPLEDPTSLKPSFELRTVTQRGPVVTIRVQPRLAGPKGSQRAILGVTVSLAQAEFDLSEGRPAVAALGAFFKAQREGGQQAMDIFQLALALSWPPEALTTALVV